MYFIVVNSYLKTFAVKAFITYYKTKLYVMSNFNLLLKALLYALNKISVFSEVMPRSIRLRPETFIYLAMIRIMVRRLA